MHHQEEDMSDKQAIESLARTYFECMHESSRDKALTVFHPHARIVGLRKGALVDRTAAEFGDLVASVQPSAASKGEPERFEILSIDIVGETATTRIRCDFAGTTYLDTLSLLKVDGQWRIFNKLFHIEGKAA